MLNIHTIRFTFKISSELNEFKIIKITAKNYKIYFSDDFDKD